MKRSQFSREDLLRVSALILLSTCILTLDFLGVLSLFEPGAGGMGDRFPYYLLFASIVFVGSLFYLEAHFERGIQIIAAAVGFGVLSFFVVTLGVEGLLFGITSPDKVLTENLLIYFVTAGLICTGLGFWTLRHWREYLRSNRPHTR